MFNTIHGSGRAAKYREDLGIIVGRCKVDVGMVVLNYKHVLIKHDSEFLASKMDYGQNHKRLRSCLAMEHLIIKFSVLF